MSKDNGGSAFPEMETDMSHDRDVGKDYPRTYSYGGMSLRDYFAGQALAGLMTSQTSEGEWRYDARQAADNAYCVAEAMLERRNRGQ